MAYRLEPDETVSEAFSRTAREQLQSAEEALTERLDDDPIEAVHGARKAIKKERALLRLVRGASDRRERRQENAELRTAGRALSGTRDADVMISALDDLAERYAGQIPHTQFTALRERLESDRDALRAQSDDHSAAAAAATRLAGSRERIGEWQLSESGWRALEDGLTRSYGEGRKAMRRAAKRPSDQRLHEWRKRAKDLWYQLRLLTPAGGETIRGQAKDAHALGDLLGDDHDLAVLHGTLQRVGADVPVDLHAVLALVDHRRAELQSHAFSLGERVYAESPKAFVGRIHRYWRARRAEVREDHEQRPAELAEITRSVS